MDERIRKVIGQVLAEFNADNNSGIYLVEVSIRGGGRKIELSADTDAGISIGECARLCRRIRDRLESDEEFAPLAEGDFELLLSSPGLGEPIKVQRQYVRHVGRLLTVVSLDREGERHEVTGRLVQAGVVDQPEPFIVLEPQKKGKKNKEAGSSPLTLRLADIVRATVLTEL
jgi:ribosome maturation factor RimP